MNLISLLGCLASRFGNEVQCDVNLEYLDEKNRLVNTLSLRLLLAYFYLPGYTFLQTWILKEMHFHLLIHNLLVMQLSSCCFSLFHHSRVFVFYEILLGCALSFGTRPLASQFSI